MSIWEAIVLAIIEGLTEFLPISSTGHMIIGSSLMGIASNDFVKLYTVCIQLGAILSVVVLYFKRFFKSLNFYFKLFVAFLPGAVAGVLLGDVIDQLLENAAGVAASLFIGGIILLYADKWFGQGKLEEEEKIKFPVAFKIGLFQCLALFPGVSRSGATIIGGMSQNLSRKLAAEFSFFLAVPTMLGATVKKLYDFKKAGLSLSGDDIQFLLLGNVVAFIVAMFAIKSFIGYLNKHGFKAFGIYRIAVGILILVLLASGKSLQVF